MVLHTSNSAHRIEYNACLSFDALVFWRKVSIAKEGKTTKRALKNLDLPLVFTILH